MFNMIKTMALMVALLLQGCAVNVKEANVISQDETPMMITQSDLEWMKAFKFGLTVEPLNIQRKDGETAQGVWIRQPGSKTVLVYFGGNQARIKQDYQRFLPELLKLNTDLVWVDHRGKGASTGKATVTALMSDGLQTFDIIKAKTDKKIALHGMSLGSFVAGYIAANRAVDGLVLEASATTTDEWVDSLMPWYAKMVTDVTIENSLKSAGNSQAVQTYRGPLYLVVGEDDEVTPPHLSQKLFEQSHSTDKQILVVAGRRHGDVLLDSQVKQKLGAFFSRL